MFPVDDYAQVYELITNLAPDFMRAALTAKIAPNTQEKKDFEEKAAYIFAINEIMKTMNQLRLNTNPPRTIPTNTRNFSRDNTNDY